VGAVEDDRQGGDFRFCDGVGSERFCSHVGILTTDEHGWTRIF
jgi:hypothetical protein